MNNLITTTKNLLAFSGGVDSTALFFLLLDKNIPFDIAIVDYNQRLQSKEEVAYAKDLALKYNKKCFITSYDDIKFSEQKARDFRYTFFTKIIKENHYEALITAHQLGDKLEWFLMQLSKGAGLNELIGIEKVNHYETHTIFRPLLDFSKDELLDYLLDNQHKYFIDETNIDIKFKRNFFRKKFSDEFISLYKDGVKRSFEYLQNDINSLQLNTSSFKIDELLIIKFDTTDLNLIIKSIDKEMKKRGILLSSKSRENITKEKSIVISHKLSVNICENIVWIAPFLKETMEHKFKEFCRINKIPKNIRSYIAKLKKEEIEKIINFIKK